MTYLSLTLTFRLKTEKIQRPAAESSSTQAASDGEDVMRNLSDRKSTRLAIVLLRTIHMLFLVSPLRACGKFLRASFFNLCCV